MQLNASPSPVVFSPSTPAPISPPLQRLPCLLTFVSVHISIPAAFQCDVDIGSSAVANGIVRFVLGYVRTLIVDMAFLLQVSPILILRVRAYVFKCIWRHPRTS